VSTLAHVPFFSGVLNVGHHKALTYNISDLRYMLCKLISQTSSLIVYRKWRTFHPISTVSGVLKFCMLVVS
jgi:hypothetical protein